MITLLLLVGDFFLILAIYSLVWALDAPERQRRRRQLDAEFRRVYNDPAWVRYREVTGIEPRELK